jgi:hypothetical protein
MEHTTPTLEMRDWFAGVALPSIVNDLCFYSQKSTEEAVKDDQVFWSEVRNDALSYRDIADCAAYAAYLVADAMLEARENSRLERTE